MNPTEIRIWVSTVCCCQFSHCALISARSVDVRGLTTCTGHRYAGGAIGTASTTVCVHRPQALRPLTYTWTATNTKHCLRMICCSTALRSGHGVKPCHTPARRSPPAAPRGRRRPPRRSARPRPQRPGAFRSESRAPAAQGELSLDGYAFAMHGCVHADSDARSTSRLSRR